MSIDKPIPEDFPAGWQAVEAGLVEDGDLLVTTDDVKIWASGAIGADVKHFTNCGPSGDGSFRAVYRRMPTPAHLDNDVPEFAKGDFKHVDKLPDLGVRPHVPVPLPGSDPLPDTGARSQYATGAVRDASVGKGHFHSIPPSARRAIAKRFEDGARKYTKDNWMKGIPLSHYIDSMSRHQIGIETGDTSEDHYGALLWNASAMLWTEEEIKAGRLPADLDDLPYRKR